MKMSPANKTRWTPGVWGYHLHKYCTMLRTGRTLRHPCFCFSRCGHFAFDRNFESSLGYRGPNKLDWTSRTFLYSLYNNLGFGRSVKLLLAFDSTVILGFLSPTLCSLGSDLIENISSINSFIFADVLVSCCPTMDRLFRAFPCNRQCLGSHVTILWSWLHVDIHCETRSLHHQATYKKSCL
jgi:hypothetical protein